MTTHDSDKVFSGSIPELYETYLVPLIFDPYARDLARRVGDEPVSQVLEIAAGTGVVTRAMADVLEPDVRITASDLNQPMLDHGASLLVAGNVDWRQADALALPFEDTSFDVVVCQFGVMFFPERAAAYAEVLRVLKPGGRFLFSTWDHLGENEFADTVTEALASVFPENPPRFLARTPHGYSDICEITSELLAGGFRATPNVETMEARSRASDPSIPALAYCQGTPLRNEIESRNASLLGHATDVATEAVSRRFGAGPVEGKIKAHIVSIRA